MKNQVFKKNKIESKKSAYLFVIILIFLTFKGFAATQIIRLLIYLNVLLIIFSYDRILLNRKYKFLYCSIISFNIILSIIYLIQRWDGSLSIIAIFDYIFIVYFGILIWLILLFFIHKQTRDIILTVLYIILVILAMIGIIIETKKFLTIPFFILFIIGILLVSVKEHKKKSRFNKRMNLTVVMLLCFDYSMLRILM